MRPRNARALRRLDGSTARALKDAAYWNASTNKLLIPHELLVNSQTHKLGHEANYTERANESIGS